MAPKPQQKGPKGKGNLFKEPTKGELEKDAAILAMRWTWSYEKDELHAEQFGIDDLWSKKVYFDRARLTSKEQSEYPDPKKPPPWIDSGEGKPVKVVMSICGSDVCINGGWMQDPKRAHPSKGQGKLKKAVKEMIAVQHLTESSVPKEGYLRLDEPPRDKSCPSVWAEYRSRQPAAVIYGRVYPEKAIRKSTHNEKFINWLAKLREPAERTAAEAKAAAGACACLPVLVLAWRFRPLCVLLPHTVVIGCFLRMS